MFEFLGKLLDTSDFPARWHCGQWTPTHGWIHVLSDVAIFGAYTAIPCVLAYFILRRRDVPFPRILWLFVAFIFACGFVHLIEAIIFWHPVYRLSGLVKLTTAIVSWGTVVALVQIVPQALHLPGLARLNDELRNEVGERQRAEQALRESENKLASLLDSERAAREEAERANRTKDEFLSTVSHELRTPLNAILGYAQLLQCGKATAGDIGDGLKVIERNAKAQAQIIDDLLDMSRIITGNLRLSVALVELVPVIEAAIATVKPAADAKNIRLQSVLDSRSTRVFGDCGRLQQVVWNVLINAIKFTPKGGRVQIVLERVDSHAEIRISDSGQGIAAEVLPFIFDRFRQGDASTAKRHGGLGLGLSIVKHLVELHGGTVTASSSGPDQGATFVVSLPMQPVQSLDLELNTPRTMSTIADAASLSLKGIRVLVVDDDADARELVRRLLEECAAHVILAKSAVEAFELFTKERPDVVLSDIGMPDRDGYELIRKIRALSEHEGGNVPAAALTALVRAEDRKRAMLAGFQAHISKPVDVGELIAVVATLMGRTGR